MREISEGIYIKNYRQSVNSEREESVFPNNETFQGIIPKHMHSTKWKKQMAHRNSLMKEWNKEESHYIYIMLIHENLKINFKIIPRSGPE